MTLAPGQPEPDTYATPPAYGGAAPAGSGPAGFGSAGFGPADSGQASAKPLMNGFAVVAFVISFCGGTLLSIAFAIVALVQLRRSGERGRALAISALIISIVWLPLLAGTIVAAVATGSIKVGLTLDDLRAGQCVTEVPAFRSAPVDLVLCRDPHEVEVFAVFPLAGANYTGDGDIAIRAKYGCWQQLDAYLSPTVDPRDIYITYYPPSRQSWAKGDKTVICVAETPTRTDSIRRR